MQTSPPTYETTTNNSCLYDSTTSTVAWSAIIAGAFTAAAVSLVLLLLGSSLGLASVSPWANSGITLATFTIATAIWLIAMQLISSGLGGYLTGRLRRKWVGVHTDEVCFRDTAHGFLSWALATIITAVFLASAASSVIGGSVKATATVAAGVAAGAGYGVTQNSSDTTADPMAYLIDRLYRSDRTNVSEGDVRNETMRILAADVKDGSVSNTDKAYLSQLVSARTGLDQTEASKRVEQVLVQMEEAKMKLKEDLDKARKAASQSSIFTFLSLLIGAFIASAAAALGGKHRDEY